MHSHLLWRFIDPIKVVQRAARSLGAVVLKLGPFDCTISVSCDARTTASSIFCGVVETLGITDNEPPISCVYCSSNWSTAIANGGVDELNARSEISSTKSRYSSAALFGARDLVCCIAIFLE